MSFAKITYLFDTKKISGLRMQKEKWTIHINRMNSEPKERKIKYRTSEIQYLWNMQLSTARNSQTCAKIQMKKS